MYKADRDIPQMYLQPKMVLSSINTEGVWILKQPARFCFLCLIEANLAASPKNDSAAQCGD